MWRAPLWKFRLIWQQYANIYAIGNDSLKWQHHMTILCSTHPLAVTCLWAKWAENLRWSNFRIQSTYRIFIHSGHSYLQLESPERQLPGNKLSLAQWAWTRFWSIMKWTTKIKKTELFYNNESHRATCWYQSSPLGGGSWVSNNTPLHIITWSREASAASQQTAFSCADTHCSVHVLWNYFSVDSRFGGNITSTTYTPNFKPSNVKGHIDFSGWYGENKPLGTLSLLSGCKIGPERITWSFNESRHFLVHLRLICLALNYRQFWRGAQARFTHVCTYYGFGYMSSKVPISIQWTCSPF